MNPNISSPKPVGRTVADFPAPQPHGNAPFATRSSWADFLDYNIRQGLHVITKSHGQRFWEPIGAQNFHSNGFKTWRNVVSWKLLFLVHKASRKVPLRLKEGTMSGKYLWVSFQRSEIQNNPKHLYLHWTPIWKKRWQTKRPDPSFSPCRWSNYKKNGHSL